MVIALIPQHAKRIKPPRALIVPYELGRPLGVPDDALFQHRVLSAALELLVRTDGPVFEHYEEQAPTREESLEGWACPISFASNVEETSTRQRVLGEVSLLQPWYDKGVKERGYTSVGLSGLTIEEIVGFLSSFLESSVLEDSSSQDSSPENSSPENKATTNSLGKFSLADSLKHCAEDLKSFYNESATAQPGDATAKEIENWYWGETEAGKMIREISRVGKESGDKMVNIIANFVLVPHSQSFRDK